MARSRIGVTAFIVFGAVVALTVVFAAGRIGGDRSVATLTASFKSSHSAMHTAAAGAKAAAPTTGENEANEAGIIRARDKWFFGQRAHPSRFTPDGAYQRAVRQAKALRESATQSAPTTSISWTLRGPRPIATIGPDAAAASGAYVGSLPASGRISAIAPDPNNANIAYLGGANGGVWKTTNAYGSPISWLPKFANNNASFSMGAIAVDRSLSGCPSTTASCRIWAGTGEANGSGDTYYGQGVYRSLNGGTTWTKASGTLFSGCFVSDLAVVNSNTIVAAVLEFPGVSNPACPLARRGVWRTANALAATPTWTKISLPSSSYQAPADFSQPPTAPGVIFAATYIDGVYRSINGGLTWTKIASASGLYRPAISAYNTNIVYVVYSGGSSGSSFGGVFRTLNASAATPSWTTQVPGSASNTPCTYPGGSYGQCSYDLTLAVDPTNYTRFFVGGIRMYRYTSSGAVGTPIGYGGCAGCIHVDQHATVFDRLNHLWQGSDGGVYRTDNLGASFVNRNASLGITEYTGWTSGSIAAGTFIGGTQDNGTTKYTSATGLNWRMDHGGDGGASAFYNSSIYFASYYGPALYRTSNGGGSYTKVSSATIDSSPSEFYPPLESGPNAQTLYRGTNRVWRTTNAVTGAPPSWLAKSPVFTGTVSAIGVSPSNANYLYAGWNASTTQMRYTHNATLASPTWFNSSGLPNRYITDIHVQPSNPNIAIATFSGFNSTTTNGHVFRTLNGGASWTNISGTLPNTPVNAVAVDYSKSPARIFVGTDIGVYWSVDGGATWGNTSVGLPNTTVMDLRIAGGLLIAATHGRSVYSAPLPA
jgi:hypothetical protein